MHKPTLHNWNFQTKLTGFSVAGTLLAVAILFSAAGARRVSAQGLPPEAREHIHTLFSQHTNLVRTVKITDDGYVALTESKDPAVAKALRQHVSEMRKRLQSGSMVRGWDPAFRELVEHYDDITHRVEATDSGLKITVRGKTPEGVAVAKNHAKIISGFVEKGWDNHDTRHPRAAENSSETDVAKTGGNGAMCCAGGTCSSGKHQGQGPGGPKKNKGNAGGCPNCKK